MSSKDLNSIIQELRSLQNYLDSLDSLDDILVTYEKMFSLIHESLDRILVKDQQCYILSAQPNGILKDTLDQPVLKTFSMTIKP
ncbi:hypothetical protein SBV42_03650 [Chlamydia crocodili]|uniref:Uncharacterized protein n=1 Tax=Chlamydia crocodili TaxID=2766982 RepID=A0ABX8CGY5_9CHLA|nr:hypothetical protein [Chlamydia crocodili]QVE48857.1 hypothetical protein H9Q19_04020 [Chlamydia crocodili]